MVERALRINSLFKRELGKIISREMDFENDVLITITRVDTSSNLIQSKVYISVIPDGKMPEIMRELNKNIYHIQQKLNKILRIRPVPKIIFEEEEMTAGAGRIEKILNDIRDDSAR